MDSEARLELTADIVSAYLSNNSLPSSALADLIQTVHQTLSKLGAPVEEASVPLTPAVPVKKSVTPDYLISLEDGRQYRTLKRHITRLGMTPQEYRAKWGLPADYPMTAASYSARRSELAKTVGLGRKRQPEASSQPSQAQTAVAQQPEEPAPAASAPKKRGRPKKAAA